MQVLPPDPPIRAVFIDIDGTLVGADEEISAGNRRALASAGEAGCVVVLCTGRTMFRAKPIAEQVGLDRGYLVASNGGVVMHLGRGEVVCRRLLPVPLALDIVHAILAVGLEPYVYEDSDTPGVAGSRVLYDPDLPLGHWVQHPRYLPHAAIRHSLPFDPVSVSAFGPPPRMLSLIPRLMERLPPGVSVVRSGAVGVMGVEIYVGDVGKRSGLELVTERLGLRADEVMAIGDHLNDLDMIRWAGIGVAMGDAAPEVLAAADWVTAPMDEDGVARAIERFILSDAGHETQRTPAPSIAVNA